MAALDPELRIEAENLGADLIGLATPSRPGPHHQLRTWCLGATLSAPVVLLPLVPDDRPRESVAPPGFR